MRVSGALSVAVVGALGALLGPAAVGASTGAPSPVAARGAFGGAHNATTASPLLDHGGTVLASSTTHAIWWGPTAQFPADAQSAIPTELAGFAGSSYLGIAQQYMRGASISTSYGGSVSDLSAPPASSPKTQTIVSEVARFFPNPDPNAVYFVYTSNRPNNVNFCGWHFYGTIGRTTVQVAYVPNYPTACDPLVATNLNANSLDQGTRAMADTTAHEFMEAITDPLVTAWYDKSKSEIGDKCNFVYFAPVVLSNKSTWQIQAEWSNALGGCQQQ